MRVMMLPMMTRYFAWVSESISLEVRISKYLTTPANIDPIPRLQIGENRIPMRKIPNKAISTNAVVFARHAKAKKIPDKIRYFRISFFCACPC